MVLPEEVYDVVWQGVDAKVNQIQYSQIIIPLSALLDGDFFNLYIKTGTKLSSFHSVSLVQFLV